MVRGNLRPDSVTATRRVVTAALAAAVIVVATMNKPGAAQSPLPGGLPPPPGMSMPDYARHRFPQAVSVGSLVGEVVQRPVESHDRLGIVRAIVRGHDGMPAAVIRNGAWFGIGGHDILVPLDAIALLGSVVEIVGFAPRELDRFPRFTPATINVLPPSAVVRVGLAKPSH